MKYYGLRIYDLEESIIASSFPMLKKKMNPADFEHAVASLESSLNEYDVQAFSDAKLTIEDINSSSYSSKYKTSLKHIKRAMNLGNAKPSSGHDCFTKGILVSVNIEADQSFWLQWERYHHQDTISSMSTMHCLTKFDLNDGLFSQWTDKRVIEILNELIEQYNIDPTPENFHKVIHSCPEGIELCRRVTTNYLQFKTMYSQRKNHKMYSWSKDFDRLCKELPYFYEICLKEREM